MLRYLGIAGVSGLAGCGGDGGGDTTTATTTASQETTTTPTPTTTVESLPEVTGKFTNAFSSAASTLNWFFNVEAGTDARIGLTLDGAWAITTENEVFPLWCEVETQDNKVYSITVRDGLQWGKDFGQMTAEDWVYMIKNLFQGENNWTGYPNASDWKGVTVTKTGDMTFDIELKSADPFWPLRPVMWGQYCAPKEVFKPYVQMKKDGSPDQAAKQLEQDETLNNLEYTGNLGPYTKETWEQDAQFVATRNDDYYMHDRDDVPELWTGAPYFTQTVHRVIPEQSARLSALDQGVIETASIPPNRAQEFMDMDNVDVYVQPQPFVRVVSLNMRANGFLPFRDKRVRQAFAQVINKKSFVQNVFRGFAKTASTMQPKWSKWYSDEFVKKWGVGDLYSPADALSKMKTAISENDWDYSYDGDTLVNAEGTQAQISFIAQSGQPTEQTMAEVLKQAIQQLGVKVNIKTVPGRTFQVKYAINKPPEDKKDQVPKDWPPGPFNGGPRDVSVSQEPWDMALIFEFNTYPRTPSDSKVFFYERGSVNYYGYVPSEGVNIKKMYEDAVAADSEQKRKELFAKAFGVISEEQPFLFLAMEDDIVGYEDDIVGPEEKFGAGWNSVTYRRG
ncbi:MAG: ABC transporter substrate-binding protein [Halobacteriaceae archaeon]